MDLHGLVNSHPRVQDLRSDLWGRRQVKVTPQRGERNPNQDDDRDGRDIFSKSEKWLPPMPTVDFKNWRTRADEVLGFSDGITSFRLNCTANASGSIRSVS